MISKTTLLSFFICFCKVSLAQVLEFRCFVKTVCSDSVLLLNDYSLKGKDTVYYSQNGVSTVDKLGTYVLYSQTLNFGVEPIVFKFSSFQSHISDTIQNIALYSIVRPKKPKRKYKTGDWFYCDKLAEGYLVDYYLNGRKRIEGDFKKGSPIGILKYYNQSGTKIFQVHYKKGKKVKSEYLEISSDSR